MPQEENTGDYYYRAYAPGIAMARCQSVHTVNLTNVNRAKLDLMRFADLLVLNNICDPDILPVIEARKKSGKITVYELADDLADMPACNPRGEFYRESKNLLLVKRLANYCDALQFSSRELQRKYGYLNAISVVFPNHILEVAPQREDDFPEKMVVGWGGSFGHMEDVEQIAEPLMDWILSRNDVRFHLMSAAPIRELFARLPSERIKWFPPGSLKDYYKFVETLHVGLAPLRDTPFNRSRSDVKFLEYAAHGVVPVLQATGPYLDSVEDRKTGFLYSATREMISILDALAAEPGLRVRTARAAWSHVQKERDQLRRGGDRVEFYRRLVSTSLTGSARQFFEECCGLGGAEVCGRNVFLRSTRFESLLLNGLMILSDKPRAREMFREAIEMIPENYMPYLFGAGVSDDPIGYLQKAVAKNPLSISSRLMLAWEYGRKNNAEMAVKCFRAAADIFPGYEYPYTEWAHFLKAIGLTSQALPLLKIALGVIPDVLKSASPLPGVA